MKATHNVQRQSAGFAISDILELNERTPGAESVHEQPLYSHHQELTHGQTLLTSPTRHWPTIPQHTDLGKSFKIKF